MNDNELYEQARNREERNIKRRGISDKDIIIQQEKEIQYYRQRIERILDKKSTKQTQSKHKLKIEIDSDKAIQDIRKVKKEVKELVNECTFEINKLELKRRDILVIKIHTFLEVNNMKSMKKELERQLHRRVLLINDNINIDHVISYRKK